MIALSLAEIAGIVGGQPHDMPDPSVVVTGPVVIDSREVRQGSLFAAFAGERVDGHDYAQRAVEAGAAAVLAARPVGVPAIVVDDVVAALGALARSVVERLGTTVVGLTGSAGKTSTKDLIAQLLERKAPTVWTPGSLNNEIGLPLTALRATAETRHLVLEMGARG
ncbi:MAG TPA: Mur ligase family protein, partial [Streptomyces sp.]|uniref:Mur ligase family protein n=1 Tax=Streptomyces sp. TaxID=1931 RepID=UPI002C9D694C